MSVTKVLSLNGGIQTEVVPATTSAGSASAGQIVALNSSGQVDSSMLPSSGGSTSSGPSMIVPRNMYFHMVGVDAEGNGFDVFNAYKNSPQYKGAAGGSTAFTFSGWFNHEAATDYSQGITGTTLTSCLSWAMNSPKIPAGLNCSSRITANLQQTSGIIAWVSLLDQGLDVLSSVAGSPDIGLASGTAMIALRFYPDAPANDTTWKLYICDGVNPSQIIDTGVAPTVPNANTRVPCQVFDAFYTASGVLTVAIDGVAVVGPMTPTYPPFPPSNYLFGQNRGLQNTVVVQNTTTTPVSAGWAFGYLGCDGDKSS